MRVVYPVIISKHDDWHIVQVPDLDQSTQGTDLYDAIYMARDLISLCCVDMQNEGKELPKPSEISAITHKTDEILTLVDCDLDEYRKMISQMEIRKTVKISGQINATAKNEKINVSQVLQQALKAELGIDQQQG